MGSYELADPSAVQYSANEYGVGGLGSRALALNTIDCIIAHGPTPMY